MAKTGKFRGFDQRDTTGSGDSSSLRKYFSQGIEWTTQVGAEGGSNSESDMDVVGVSNPARSRSTTGSQRS